MNYTQTVRDYIDKTDVNTPIFLFDIKELVGENAKLILSRLVKDKTIIRYGNGVYYKPTETIWGTSVVGVDSIIKYKYIQNRTGEIKGYITGPRLFNRLGLTTQVPRMTDIVTNEHTGKNKYVTEYGAVIQKPKIKVDAENYLYQQLLDVVENKANVQIEVDTPQPLIQAFYMDNNLDFATLYKVGIDRGVTERNLHKMSLMVLGGYQ